MNEDQKTKDSARIEIVPFPSASEVSTPVDTTESEVDPDLVEPSVTRSKQATGWAASGLAGALRRSRRTGA